MMIIMKHIRAMRWVNVVYEVKTKKAMTFTDDEQEREDSKTCY